ncbi:uncharacterized protein LOC132193084 [Neocloeon triangulifer]|uniref:uncharacterized protein LOC132193084 n=1 Tax=Neocloeon triangulifer TaxID=2078957 RepID=UPI00286F2AFA|nr:uncharacterized protein LOC132193084 [Neocloeon triangulifer]XP_059469445.1 uncharacterized protein LOC132193084 [Neocloeon triangulifer]
MSSGVLLVRDYRPGDEISCCEIVQEGTMSTVNRAFVSALIREVTFQLMVLASAIMFIFMGLPLKACLYVIPGVIVFMYLAVWGGHMFKALEQQQDVRNVPRMYMSSENTGFWVAEVFEPFFSNGATGKLALVNEAGLKGCGLDLTNCRRVLVGTIAVSKSKLNPEQGAWIKRLAVKNKYRHRGVGTALLNEAISFCRTSGYQEVELVTSECQDTARELCFKQGFDLKQMYHRPVFGPLATMTMYQLLCRLHSNQVKNL